MLSYSISYFTIIFRKGTVLNKIEFIVLNGLIKGMVGGNKRMSAFINQCI